MVRLFSFGGVVWGDDSMALMNMMLIFAMTISCIWAHVKGRRHNELPVFVKKRKSKLFAVAQHPKNALIYPILACILHISHTNLNLGHPHSGSLERLCFNDEEQKYADVTLSDPISQRPNNQPCPSLTRRCRKLPWDLFIFRVPYVLMTVMHASFQWLTLSRTSLTIRLLAVRLT